MKRVGHCLYTHRDFTEGLPQDELRAALDRIGDFNYTYIKFNRERRTFSFMYSPDWDTSDEPVCTEAVHVRPDGQVTRMSWPENPPVVHAKHLFVGREYAGFDTEEAKQRYASYADRLTAHDRCRMGRQNVWRQMQLNLQIAAVRARVATI